MDFGFSEEQDMLRRSAREVMRDRYPPERIAAIADGEGFDRSEWTTIAEMGWTSISVPESEGGAGLGFVEEIVLAEELGRALYPGPFLSAVGLALPLLRAAGDPDLAGAVARGERTATVAWAGPDGRFDADPAPKVEWEGERITARRMFVPDLPVADAVVVVGGLPEGTGVWVAEGTEGGVERRAHATVDATRPMGEITMQAAPVPLTGILDAGALPSLRDRGLAALAAEAVGVGSAALDMAAAHVRERRQFGRPIGAFQAVAHQLADSYLELETARSLAYWAGWAVAEAVPEAPVAAAAAKSRAAEGAMHSCERAMQVHGGLGFTWEHPLHLWYKRSLGIGAFLGWGPEHRGRVAAAILD